MPSTSSLTSSEKALIKKHAPVGSAHDKIHTAAIARVYYAFPDPAKWSYSGISGALVYGWGQKGGWLRVVDLAVSLGLKRGGVGWRTRRAPSELTRGEPNSGLQGTRGVIWDHQVAEDTQYYQDRTFFHTFPSDVSTQASPDASRSV